MDKGLKMAEGKAVKEIDDGGFATAIAKGVTLVDFSAEWCGPCRMLAPILEEVAKAIKGKASVLKIDIDQNQKTTSEFQVTSVPTLILFKNGAEVNRIVGLKDAETLKKLISAAL